MATWLKEVFTKFELWHVVSENNERVNLLSKLAGKKKKGQYRIVIQETILEPSIDKAIVSVTPVDRELRI